MSNTNNTIIRRRPVLASDITVRGIVSDIKVGFGAGVKNTANLGLASVEIFNEAIPMIKEAGYNTIDTLQVVNRAHRMANIEMNTMVNEWMESSEADPSLVNDMTLTAAEVADRLWKQRKAKEAEEKAKKEQKNIVPSFEEKEGTVKAVSWSATLPKIQW